MAEHDLSTDSAGLVRIEPEDRLVVLARTVEAQGAPAEARLQAQALEWQRLGETCLGQALYRHHAVFRGASEAPVWSHLELTYFRDIVPAAVIQDRVVQPQAPGIRLLRAEILLTTPSAFVLPQDWQGIADAPGRRASLEYIDVQPPFLGAYREIMRRYLGPAAQRLVRAGRIGTFRTLETAAVLHRDPGFGVDWNQIHLCEVEAEGFAGFGAAFDEVLRDIAPEGGFTSMFAGLDRMRSIPRWTLNDPVVEADLGLVQGAAPTA